MTRRGSAAAGAAAVVAPATVSGVVRALGACARCDGPATACAVRRVDERLDVGGRAVRHQLIVCERCDRWHADAPTPMEADALACAVPDPAAAAVHAAAFAARWSVDVARVQRTARYFLGVDRNAASLAAGHGAPGDRVAPLAPAT